jgi:hypothetical protein
MLETLRPADWNPRALRRDGVLKVAVGFGFDEAGRHRDARSLVAEGLKSRDFRPVNEDPRIDSLLRQMGTTRAQLDPWGDYFVGPATVAGEPGNAMVRLVTPDSIDAHRQFAGGICRAGVSAFLGHGDLGTQMRFGPRGSSRHLVVDPVPTLHGNQPAEAELAGQLLRALKGRSSDFAKLPVDEGARLLVLQTCNSADMVEPLKEALAPRSGDLAIVGTRGPLDEPSQLAKGLFTTLDALQADATPEQLAIAMAAANGVPMVVDTGSDLYAP